MFDKSFDCNYQNWSRSFMSDSATPWTIACQVLLSIGFSRQEYWSGLLFPSLGDIPNPEIKPRSPALKADSFLAEPQRNPSNYQRLGQKYVHNWWSVLTQITQLLLRSNRKLERQVKRESFFRMWLSWTGRMAISVLSKQKHNGATIRKVSEKQTTRTGFD